MRIRSYDPIDFEVIQSWWKEQDQVPPLKGMMVEDGTFVLEYSGEPVMTLTAFRTQSLEVCYFEGYCAKPGLDRKLRNHLGKILWNHCYSYLKKNGAKRVTAFTEKKRLAQRYEDLGMMPTLKGLYALTKEFTCPGQP